MPNTSATGGYLTPSASPAPLEDAQLLDFFHDWIVGITGLTNDLVRPRWQLEPPNIPGDVVTWLAFGIEKRVSDPFVANLHFSTGNGYDQLRRHEILHFLVSCYGPAADSVLQILRDGMQVPQNLEPLSLNSMGLVESGDLIAAPELFKDKWLYRVDMPFSIKRQILRNYSVETILTSGINLIEDIPPGSLTGTVTSIQVP